MFMEYAEQLQITVAQGNGMTLLDRNWLNRQLAPSKALSPQEPVESPTNF